MSKRWNWLVCYSIQGRVVYFHNVDKPVVITNIEWLASEIQKTFVELTNKKLHSSSELVDVLMHHHILCSLRNNPDEDSFPAWPLNMHKEPVVPWVCSIS